MTEGDEFEQLYGSSGSTVAHPTGAPQAKPVSQAAGGDEDDLYDQIYGGGDAPTHSGATGQNGKPLARPQAPKIASVLKQPQLASPPKAKTVSFQLPFPSTAEDDDDDLDIQLDEPNDDDEDDLDIQLDDTMEDVPPLLAGGGLMSVGHGEGMPPRPHAMHFKQQMPPHVPGPRPPLVPPPASAAVPPPRPPPGPPPPGTPAHVVPNNFPASSWPRPRYVHSASGAAVVAGKPLVTEEAAFPCDAKPGQPIKLPGQTRVSPEEYKAFLALGHGEIFDLDLDRVVDAPWRHPSSDKSDFFNYGMNELGWKQYCDRIQQYRLEYTMQKKIQTYESGPSVPEGDPDLPPELLAAVQAERNKAGARPEGEEGEGPSFRPIPVFDDDAFNKQWGDKTQPRGRDFHRRPEKDSLDVIIVLTGGDNDDNTSKPPPNIPPPRPPPGPPPAKPPDFHWLARPPQPPPGPSMKEHGMNVDRSDMAPLFPPPFGLPPPFPPPITEHTHDMLHFPPPFAVEDIGLPPEMTEEAKNWRSRRGGIDDGRGEDEDDVDRDRRDKRRGRDGDHVAPGALALGMDLEVLPMPWQIMNGSRMEEGGRDDRRRRGERHRDRDVEDMDYDGGRSSHRQGERSSRRGESHRDRDRDKGGDHDYRQRQGKHRSHSEDDGEGHSRRGPEHSDWQASDAQRARSDHDKDRSRNRSKKPKADAYDDEWQEPDWGDMAMNWEYQKEYEEFERKAKRSTRVDDDAARGDEDDRKRRRRRRGDSE